MSVEVASARRNRARTCATVLAVLLMVAGVALVSARASAALTLPGDPSPQPGARGYLTLGAEPNPLVFAAMSPGEVGYGQITITLDDAPTSELSLEMFAAGGLLEHENGLTLSVSVCDRPWSPMPADVVTSSAGRPACDTNEQPIASTGAGTVSTGAPAWNLGRLDAGRPRYVLVEARMPDASSIGDETLMGLSADFAFHVLAEGDDVGLDAGAPVAGVPGPGSRTGLANTGLDVLALVLIASGAIAFGTLARHRRTASPERGNGR